jgi:hypothetical protein
MPQTDARTTALGLWTHAREFADAARHVFSMEKSASLPGYYLLGHSIELSFKAFLLAAGEPLSVLKRRDLGHDLKALFARAQKHDFGSIVPLEPTEIGVISLLNFDYVAKRFEYRETGMYHLPLPHLAQSVADKLIQRLKRYCRDATIK